MTAVRRAVGPAVTLAALLSAAGTAAPSCAAPAQASVNQLALQASLTADLKHYLAERGTTEHISAAALSVSLPHGSADIDVAAGTTAYRGGTVLAPSSLFQIGSNTKAFTSSIILQLEAQGKLHIDDPLGDYLPQYPAWKRVTIRSMLDMTSRIPSYDNVPTMGKDYANNPYRNFTLAQLVSYVYPASKGAPKPTHGWSYSNTNYVLCEMIIEKLSGDTYANEVQQRIIKPLNLTDMYYEPNFYPLAVSARMPSGYFYNHTAGNEPFAPLLGKDTRLLSLSWTQGAGGAVGSMQALAHWARALYQDPNFLAGPQRRELESIVSNATGKPIPATSEKDPKGFGLGVGQLWFPRIGNVWYYEGETLGYRTLYVWYPKKDVVIAVGLNSQPDSNQDKIGALVSSVYDTLHNAGAL